MPYICIVMKSPKAILSCFFAVLVFCSSSTFSIGIHSCGGQVKAIAFLDKADGCDHRNLPPCHRKLVEKCCDDDVVTHKGQGFDKPINTLLNAVATAFVMVAPPVVLLNEVIPAGSNIARTDTDYDPPLPAVNRTVVLRTFLI